MPYSVYLLRFDSVYSNNIEKLNELIGRVGPMLLL